jgi:hypothetical protein
VYNEGSIVGRIAVREWTAVDTVVGLSDQDLVRGRVEGAAGGERMDVIEKLPNSEVRFKAPVASDGTFTLGHFVGASECAVIIEAESWREVHILHPGVDELIRVDRR